MKKIIFTLLLAIVSSVWTTSMALCLSPIPDAVYQPFATVSGTFASVPIPCEPIDEYPCPACLTLALQTSDRLYYLTADNADIQTQLEAIEYQLSLTTNITGSVSGTPYTEGSYEYIRVQAVDTNSAPLRLPSLCDEWNIAKISNTFGPQDVIHTVKAFLGSDTIIESQNYVKLIEDGAYKGALREGESGVIYYIPAGSAHEYLLYNFNAQVGDKLTNLWYGGRPEWCPNGYNATVLSISDETPRVFTVEVEFIITDSEGEHIIPWLVYWTEGVGLSDGPAGRFCPGPACACSCGQVLLCAYKNGEQVYVSEWGEQHGCEYNQTPLLSSLCNEWNVWYESFQSFGPINYNAVIKYRLATDTMINGQRYVQLASDNSPYMEGALREGSNRDIYYVPSGSTHEYLLYAFNAQEGDTITNLYVGAMGKEEGYQAIVRAISDSNPRIITVGVNIDEYTEYSIIWIEGVGSPETPCGLAVVPPSPADVGTYNLLCAYKNGEQVYVSGLGEQYGCEYNYNPDSTPADTIPLYIKDGPGTSTVEPVDPNEIVAKILDGDLLMVEYLHETIYYNLSKAPASNPSSVAAMPLNQVVAADSFIDSETVPLIESGTYSLEMSNPGWNYTIVGTFVYKAPQGIEQTSTTAPSATKTLREGQLLIRQGNRLYTPTGIRIQ